MIINKHPCKWKNKDIQEIPSNIMFHVQKQNNKITIYVSSKLKYTTNKIYKNQEEIELNILY
jgi:ribonuclease HIII